MPNPLLLTKLHIPPAGTRLVSRPRLMEALDDALQQPHNLILVSAPAGFGKTLLVSEWISKLRNSKSKMSFAWLSLDKDDNDPARFWRYLITALKNADAPIGQALQTVLEASQPPPLETLVTALINELNALTQPTILVLDDYHLIDAEPIHASINYLLDHLPPHLCLVIITRVDPPLMLSRRRGRAQLTEARTADLRFTLAETGEYINTCMSLNLPDEDIVTLERRTEGWIVGLQLAALSLRQQENRHAFVTSFAGDDRYVGDYLLEEVLQQQTPRIHSFLLQTSILERLCAPLCEAVTGETDSQTILTYLEQSNLFIEPLDNRRYWYRYHHLFADLLRRRLCQWMAPDQQLTLYRQASTWYEGEGFVNEAISQALAAPDPEFVADLLEQHALAVFFRSETMIVHSWLSALPAPVLQSRPLLCALYANSIAHKHHFSPSALQQSEAYLREAEQTLAASADLSGLAGQKMMPGYDLARCMIGLSHAYLALWQKEKPQTVIEVATRALANLPPADQSPADPNFLRIRSGLNNNLGMSYMALGDEESADRAFTQARQIGEACGDLLNACAATHLQSSILCKHGHLHEAAALCQEALESYTQRYLFPESTIPYTGILYISLGQIYLEWNDLKNAEPMLVKGLEFSQLTTQTHIQLHGYFALARLRQARGEAASAHEVLNQVGQWYPDATTLVEAQRVRLRLASVLDGPGQLEAATRWAKEHRLVIVPQERSDLEPFSLARVLIAQYRVADPTQSRTHPDLGPLQQFLDEQLQIAEAGGWIERSIELLILQALTWQVQKKTPNAIDALERALKFAEPGGYVRLFVDEGRPMKSLIEEFRTRIMEKSLKSKDEPYLSLLAYVDRLSAAFPASSTTAQTTIRNLQSSKIQALSEREIEVLRGLLAGDTNAEIAQKLFITLNTTKKHVTHIFEKLAVSSRSEAVKRARELGMVD